MNYSDHKTGYGFSAADIHAYRESTSASMMEAKKHLMSIHRHQVKAEMVELIESGTLEDIQKIVRILIEAY